MTTKEHPILFSDEMVCAILDGRKTQTRRPVKPRDPTWTYTIADDSSGGIWWIYDVNEEGDYNPCRCPFGVPGDRLWVRETWSPADDDPEHPTGAYYRATHSEYDESIKWRPNIHMPRWASRIDLEVTAVRVERIQNIHRNDALAEGTDLSHELFRNINAPDKARRLFPQLWDSIYAKKGFGWDANPWVWVVEFEYPEVKP